jgi:hypothetical protein
LFCSGVDNGTNFAIMCSYDPEYIS